MKVYIERTKSKLKNSLKGQATLVLNQNEQMSSYEDKKKELEIIEEFLHYIENFEKNKEILKRYDEKER